MIYHKMWLVVKPTVGIPVFLGAVAISSFAVHLAVISQVDWYKSYANGSPAAKKTAEAQTNTAALAVPAEKAALSEKSK
jgi:light-harvesting protein B-800-850 alpha chain